MSVISLADWSAYPGGPSPTEWAAITFVTCPTHVIRTTQDHVKLTATWPTYHIITTRRMTRQRWPHQCVDSLSNNALPRVPCNAFVSRIAGDYMGKSCSTSTSDTFALRRRVHHRQAAFCCAFIPFGLPESGAPSGGNLAELLFLQCVDYKHIFICFKN